MKILFIADTLAGGGKERRLVELIKGLGLESSFQLKLLILDKAIQFNDIYSTKCEIKTLERKKGAGFEFNIWREIENLCSEFKPDIIHFWGEVGMAYLIPRLYLKKTPTVSSIIANTSPRGGILKKLLRKLSFRGTSLILSNTYLGLKAYNIPLNKGKVIYNGFDFQRIKNLKNEDFILEKYGIENKIIIMMVGAYSIRKDYPTFLEATELLINQGRKISVVTAGHGDYSNLLSLVSPQNLKHYSFLSFQEDVESIMNLASIGVLCSNSNIHGEGISNALLEFMAMKKPVVATNDGGNVELIDNGRTGYLVKPSDAKDLAIKLDILLNNQDLRSSMGSFSREAIEMKFSINSMITEFKESYKLLAK